MTSTLSSFFFYNISNDYLCRLALYGIGFLHSLIDDGFFPFRRPWTPLAFVFHKWFYDAVRDVYDAVSDGDSPTIRIAYAGYFSHRPTCPTMTSSRRCAAAFAKATVGFVIEFCCESDGFRSCQNSSRRFRNRTHSMKMCFRHHRLNQLTSHDLSTIGSSR